MKIDLYTKTVLTVIAGALLYLCFATNLLQVRAESNDKTPPQRVIIVGVDTKDVLPVAVGFAGENGVTWPVTIGQPLPVTGRR